MIRQSLQLTVSLLTAVTLVSTTYAKDSDQPPRVLMTQQSLTTEQAQAAQKAWADHLEVDTVIENSIGMQLCVIPPGTFPMCWEAKKRGAGSQVVTHSQPFFIGQYEVTQGQWERVMGPLRWERTAGTGDRFPINAISYLEAVEFCRRLTRLDRKAGTLPEGYEYRLPTDAELEYANRAGTLAATYFGEKLSSTHANFDGTQPLNGAEPGPYPHKLVEVGSYPANPWGLHDTIGNVAEWCLDWYHDKVKPGVDPVHLLPSPKRRIPQRVAKGGSYRAKGHYCRTANRYHSVPDQRDGGIGVRPVLSKLHLDSAHQTTVGSQTDYLQTWTRNGTSTRIWNKRGQNRGEYYVMAGPIDHFPGRSFPVALTDRKHHTWAHACLADGRVLVSSNPLNQEPGYYLMTPGKDAAPKFARIHCDLADQGVLDRIRLSPSETKICFEFQSGFDSDASAPALYVADFDASELTITGANPIAGEGDSSVRYAWPRWSKDEAGIVYQGGENLYRYNLASKSTTKIE